MDAADSQRRHRRRVKKAAYRRAATHAGLRYVTDGARGIRRKRVGGGWAYFAPGGAGITDHEIRKRLNSLAIPPDWTEVWNCPRPAGRIEPPARDGAGRKQSRCHPQYREARDRS